MADLDNLQIVRAEGNGNCSGCAKEGMDAQGQHQQEGSQERYEKIACRAPANKEKVKNTLRSVAGTVSGKHRRGHSAEHASRPCGPVPRVCGVPFVGLMRHPHIAGDVALVYNLAAQHFRDKAVGNYQESQDDPYVCKYFLLDRFHSCVILSSRAAIALVVSLLEYFSILLLL